MGRFTTVAIASMLAVATFACGRYNFESLRPSDDGGTSDGDGGDVARCTFVDVAPGETTTCARGSDGSVWCWGRNNFGQAGIAPTTTPVLAGARVPLPAAATEIGVGVLHACALLVDGNVWCWGHNADGELGNGTTTPSDVPVQVPLGEAALELEVGGRHVCVRRASDSSLVCWGHNKAFALGNSGGEVAMPTPMVVAGTAGTKQFVLGHRHGCGIDATDQVYCWGRGLEGQLGVGQTPNVPTPVRPTGIGAVTAIDASNRHACVVLASGGVRCWGARYLGGSNFDQYPASVYVADGIAVAATNYSACAIHANRTVSCWGYLYDTEPVVVNNTPTPHVLADVASIHGGFYQYCAFTVDGRLHCWGSDDEGQLGRGEAHAGPQQPTAPVTVSCQ